MSLLERIIYLGDLISADRTYDGVRQLRETAYRSLNDAVFDALQFSVQSLTQKGCPVLGETFQAYNEYALLKAQGHLT